MSRRGGYSILTLAEGADEAIPAFADIARRLLVIVAGGTVFTIVRQAPVLFYKMGPDWKREIL